MRYTLLADGSSDRALLPVLTWLFQTHGVTDNLSAQWADPSVFSANSKGLTERILATLAYYECNVLCIHRDAEREPSNHRRDEIQEAVESAAITQGRELPHVCVVPVRMTEAWFLFDEAEPSIRRAADNPNGKVRLTMPGTANLERLTDPKEDLYHLLRQASQLTGRRLRDFGESRRFQRVANLIDDFAPLRKLEAFAALENEVADVVSALK